MSFVRRRFRPSRARSWRAAAVLGLLASLVAAEEAPVYRGRAFVFEVDFERARTLGWIGAADSEAAVLDTIERALWQRLRRSGKFTEGVVTAEPGGRFSITFVGKQSSGFEQLLVEGIASPGRFELHRIARQEDLDGCGTTLTAERQRLDAHAPAGGAAELAAFNALTRPAGGPCAAIRWLPPGTGREVPVAVLRAPTYLFVASRFDGIGMVTTAAGEIPGEETLGVALTLRAPDLEALRTFVSGADGREILLAINGVAALRHDFGDSIENPVVLDSGSRLETFRPLVFSFAGEPLPAPLTYVGPSERELPNVKHRDSPTAID